MFVLCRPCSLPYSILYKLIEFGGNEIVLLLLILKGEKKATVFFTTIYIPMEKPTTTTPTLSDNKSSNRVKRGRRRMCFLSFSHRNINVRTEINWPGGRDPILSHLDRRPTWTRPRDSHSRRRRPYNK